MNYYERHIGDYIKDTVSLSMLEEGAYNRLIDQCYQTEKPLPADVKEIYREARATSAAERKAVDYVLGKFFKLSDAGYAQKRIDIEISIYKDKQAKAKRSADARWNAVRTQSDRNANASESHMPTQSGGNAPQSPVPRHHINTHKPPPDGFDVFWARYPKKTAKPAALRAFKAQKVNGELPDILADIDRKAASDSWQKEGGQFIPNPATYLNQRRWEDGTGEQKNIWAGAI